MISEKNASPLEAFFLEGPKGPIFALFTPARGAIRGALLYLPPFAEEMNRCRNLVAEQTRVFSNLGYASLLLDYFGTGDSGGEFSEADWETWLADAGVALDWLETRSNQQVTLWGCRIGALLAADLANRQSERVSGLLLWQPVLNGKLFIKQYLRLRVAALVDRNLPAETTDEIRSRLKAGAIIDVAGYPISDRLVGSIEDVRMDDFDWLKGFDIDWCELVMAPGAPFPPASHKVIDALSARDNRVRRHPFTDPPIWQLHNRDQAPNLLATTTEIFR